MMMSLAFPLHIGEKGCVNVVDDDEHLMDAIEQILFTSPGERVNQPEFGCGLRNYLFEGNNDILATLAQFTVSHNLQTWLGDLITVEQVSVRSQDETLSIEIVFSKIATRERLRAEFQESL